MPVIANQGITGHIEFSDAGGIAGWAFADGSETPVTLSMFVDGWELTTVLCDTARPDVLKDGYGYERVGFHFDIPKIYYDGDDHVVEICQSDKSPLIWRLRDGSVQKAWTFSVDPEFPIARLDEWSGGDIFCWAVIVDRVTGRRRSADYVTVCQHGRKVATLFPTMARPDIAEQGESHHICGFVFPAYKIEQLTETVPLNFYVHPDGSEFVGSPLDTSKAISKPVKSQTDNIGSMHDPSLPQPPTNTVHVEPTPQHQTQRAYDLSQLESLLASGLFDEAYYLRTYPDIAEADVDPFEHFFSFGYREGRCPNEYFDPIYYAQQAAEVPIEDHQPLMHFFLFGDSQGRNPGPMFDTVWYRSKYQIPLDENALAHYLRLRFEVPLSPIPDFDADFYAKNYPDVFAAGIDMFEHFFTYGYKELRNPSAAFDVKFYVQRYLKGDFTVNPLVHFWANRHDPAVVGRPAENEVTVSREIKRFCRPGPYFEEIQPNIAVFKPRAMLLTYYLPQFHAFAENDAWWGKGFTEWTNLVRGSPRFIGHHQPRVPRDLGFYTLDHNAVMRKQIEMALAGSVAGFVFYYYWFNGKRIMDEPVNRFLADRSLDMKFALMWANENWTRRWDGEDSEVLISQDYREGDDGAMAAEFAEHFKDSRYIRLQGRPLLMIYRAGIIPDVKRAIARWRDIFRLRFKEDPIFIMAQAFKAENPYEFGFDGAIEFPPHKLTTTMVPANKEFTYLDEDFSGAIHKYDDVVAISLKEEFPKFPLIKTAIPSWDNDARRQGTGMAITGSTPPKYEAWLSKLVEIATAHPFFGEPVVCVNAWNEWCEGAYLEPDLHFGGAYLNATARAVAGRARTSLAPRLVLVGHDAFPSGAQQLLLNIGRTLRSEFGIEFEYVLLGDGKLLDEYALQGPVKVVATDSQLADKLQTLAEAGFSGAIVNSTASARAVDFLRAAKIEPILLVHELPRILREKHLLDSARNGISNASKVIFPAPFVRDAVLQELALDAELQEIIMPQGSYQKIEFDQEGYAKVRAELGLAEADALVLGVGYADLRKGFDLFLQLWRLLQDATSANPELGRICLVWVGGIDPGLADWLGPEIAVAEETGLFKMAGYRKDMAALFSAASVFALTSREDPLPTVVMEALAAGAPIVAFDRSGGIPDLLHSIREGIVVPYGNAAGMARATLDLITKGISPEDRERRHAKIATEFDFPTYVRRLAKLALPELVDVSVAVPNYNYAKYMSARLGSIFEQTYPVQEILVLDDCSRDDSLHVIPQAALDAQRTIRLIVNETNSGSVFRQWRKAAEMCNSEFIWIAEADDLSNPDFLARMVSLLATDRNMKLAFSDSRTVNGDGTSQWDSYKDYYSTVESGALRQRAVFSGEEFVKRFIAVKNLILNVSAVVWRREALLEALDHYGAELAEFRMAGDWLLYLAVLAMPHSRIGYESRALNVHRRHMASVTHALDASRHIEEIGKCHSFAAKMFALPAAVELRQRAYLSEVTVQLDGDTPTDDVQNAPDEIASFLA